MKTLRVLGTRGVPAAHGGFETFAEQLALYLVEQGWAVTVYCQQDGEGSIHEDDWRGVHRVHIPVHQQGPLGTIVFDWKAIRHAALKPELTLTLGYNTAIFCAWLRLKRVPNLINMDGIEWKRQKWGALPKIWFYLNDWAGCWLGNHLIADHPQIKKHLTSRVSDEKITMIPYGAERVNEATPETVQALGLEPGRYLTLIARAEPENSILEVVSGFSRKPRGIKLVVLGNYDVEGNAYHRAVKIAASEEVCFLGAIYDKTVLRALRFHCAAYIHGHQVGGTNPSLVEAMGAGNAVIAHDNPFNRWVAGSSAAYFTGTDGFDRVQEETLASSVKLAQMRQGSQARFEEAFTWGKVLADYEMLLSLWLPERDDSKNIIGQEEVVESIYTETKGITVGNMFLSHLAKAKQQVASLEEIAAKMHGLISILPQNVAQASDIVGNSITTGIGHDVKMIEGVDELKGEIDKINLAIESITVQINMFESREDADRVEEQGELTDEIYSLMERATAIVDESKRLIGDLDEGASQKGAQAEPSMEDLAGADYWEQANPIPSQMDNITSSQSVDVEESSLGTADTLGIIDPKNGHGSVL